MARAGCLFCLVLVSSRDGREANQKKEQVDDVFGPVFLLFCQSPGNKRKLLRQGRHVFEAHLDRGDSGTGHPIRRRPVRHGQKSATSENDGPNGKDPAAFHVSQRSSAAFRVSTVAIIDAHAYRIFVPMKELSVSEGTRTGLL